MEQQIIYYNSAACIYYSNNHYQALVLQGHASSNHSRVFNEVHRPANIHSGLHQRHPTSLVPSEHVDATQGYRESEAHHRTFSLCLVTKEGAEIDNNNIIADNTIVVAKLVYG